MVLSDYLWVLAVSVGPLILGLALIYALVKKRRLSPDERRRQDRAVRKLYRNDD
ncbi:hypothetical protein [Nitratireductor sp. ZSWI3]|uniref:hypothetical protein n=1 Tax=Nitratireductor sp. ZSWI3 TaxID=2966359 RepID=UPI00214F9F27|nr:hypothetical protein [Nitratireductor sp. ZSWI3]MCR4264668.1 hypothetical protein [Nitratireductor sp. ZSWI3]